MIKSAHLTNGWYPDTFIKWLEKNKVEYRVRNTRKLAKKLRQVKMKMVVYIKDKSYYDLCVKKYADDIILTTEPRLTSHIELLTNDSAVVIRKTLIYNKFKYVIYFRNPWNSPIKDHLKLWAKENFQEGMSSERHKWVFRGYNPRLYLSTQEDLVLIKLTWGDHISSIKVVELLDQAVA